MYSDDMITLIKKAICICYYIIANTVSYLFGRKEKP